ncbi:MAG: hypothetical protein AB1403_20575 [Candidatus Riflebacteria bacterium]
MKFLTKLGLTVAFFCLANGLFAVESMGRYEGLRVGAPDNESVSFFETRVSANDGTEDLDINVFFGKNDPEDKLKVARRVFQFWTDLTRIDYEKVFESETPVKDWVTNDVNGQRTINSEIIQGHRFVRIERVNHLLEPVNFIYIRETLEFGCDNNEITSMKMIKEHRPSREAELEIEFIGEVKNMKHVKKGLLLSDEKGNDLGVVTKVEAIDKAISEQTVENFTAAMQMEKKIIKDPAGLK